MLFLIRLKYARADIMASIMENIMANTTETMEIMESQIHRI